LIRSALIVLGITALIALALGAVGDAGQASLIWLGYRIDTKASVAIILIGLMTFIAVSFWNLALWLARSPQRAALRQAQSRRRLGEDILSRGFLAVATGDGAEARRCAVKAMDSHDNVALVRILSAMSAETAQDLPAAKAAYQSMLNVPDLKIAGMKGLMTLAMATGDKAEALRLATDAYNQPKPAMWAFKTLFEARLNQGDWALALDLIDSALNRKMISPLYCERAKAALMTALAASLEASSDSNHRQEAFDQALDYAVRAAKLLPAFTPASLIAARLLKAAGKPGRAEDLLEQAYAASAHPALWLCYRDLVIDETPRERARRLQSLIDRNPKDKESRMISLERALLTGMASDIRFGMTALEADLNDELVTRRLLGLMARACLALRDRDGANTYIAKASLARAEPQWSDIDADGMAFNYGPADWTQIILTFAQNARLSHPRYDRAAPILPELPDVASRYVASIPFVKAAQKSATPTPLPDDPGIRDSEPKLLPTSVTVKTKTTRSKRSLPKS
jgi:HemY protein